MKNFLRLLIISLVVFASCQSKKTTYKITGSVAGLDSADVFLVKAEASQAVVIDSFVMENGQFEFTGEASLPELHYLRLNEKEYFAQFFLENENIEVEAYKDSLRSTKVAGSPQTDIFNEYLDELGLLSKKFQKYQQEYQQARMNGNQDEVDRIRIDLEASSQNMEVFAKNFVRANSNSVVAPFITLSQLAGRLAYDDLKELVDTFSVEISESVYLVELKKIVEEKGRTAIGVVAPDFTMNDQEGNPVSLSSFKGKYLLIDFWASWCGPCRQENPNVVHVYNQYKDKGFDILGVSLDRNKEDWLKAIKDDGLEWNHVSDLKFWQNEVAQLYGVKSIPHTILIDPEGKIVAKNLRGEALEDKLKEVLP